MAANDRNNPIRQASSSSDYSLMEFMREFPGDASCLDRLWRDRFAPDGHHADCPRCERQRKFHRTKTRASYTCDSCGLHVHPMKGTIFEKSTTSLHLWFYAIYLIASTRCGISAKQLERELGVTYKTAHRMMKKVRTELMNDEDDEQLSGDVEIDETSWGGKPRIKLTRSEAMQFRERKTTILGMVERGGRVRLRVIPSRRGAGLSLNPPFVGRDGRGCAERRGVGRRLCVVGLVVGWPGAFERRGQALGFVFGRLGTTPAGAGSGVVFVGA